MKTSLTRSLAVLMLCSALLPVALTWASSDSVPKISAEAQALAAKFKSGNFHNVQGRELPYRYFEPAANDPPGSKYPLILYLHGESAAGADNLAQLTRTEAATVWIEPRHLAEHPVYVLAPQIPRGSQWTGEPAYSDTLTLLREFIASHPAIDSNRIYIVGFSMGATGLWHMLLKNPQLFAAAMPISGSADAYLGDTEAWAALKNTPVIIVHSYDDDIVPISAALNAAAALQAGGNDFLGYGAPTPCLWSPGSTASPHDAWYTAFHKFEVVYNSLFLGDLGRTQGGAIDPTTLYTSRALGEHITQVWDYALGTSFVIEGADKAVIIDTTMGHGGLYQYIRDHVLKNKSVALEVFLTHQHDDHIRGLASFIGASQLKKVYVHKEDSAPIIKILGPDAAKVTFVKDGDLIPLDADHVEVISVPGHTLGSIVMKYRNYLFSGDSVGTGYVGVGAFSIEEYIGSLNHLLDRMGSGHYTLYGGHTGELTAPMTEQYVHDLLACAKAIVEGSIASPIYWRSADQGTRKVSTVGRSSITYNLSDARRIKAALRSLRLSAGVLGQGYEPQFPAYLAGSAGIRVPRYAGFASYISYYYTTLDASVGTLQITPTVRDADYQRLAINGIAATSGEAHTVTLQPGANRFAITVTAADGAQRTYTLDVMRGTP